MRRRAFITLLGGAAALAPLSAEAQQGGKVHRVGLIATTSPVWELAGPDPVNPAVRAFVQGLRVLGYVEGQNLILERRSAEGQFERFGAIVAELVRLRADVIVTAGDPMAKVAKGITPTVPIVMASSTNPVGEGLVQSIARPGGNSQDSRPSSGRKSRPSAWSS
jgi:putative tryptophan/tyrosine transport system substrate-binding protein